MYVQGCMETSFGNDANSVSDSGLDAGDRNGCGNKELPHLSAWGGQ